MRHQLPKNLPRKTALALTIYAAWGLSAWALPQGATIVNGQVGISQAGSQQVIKASNGAIINWKQFSIGAGESTQFVQPTAASAVLNRVVGPDISQLMGQLRSNGQVFLINPRGIVIGGGARIDTGGFIASTLDIADADFLAGKLRFAAGAGAGRIRNDGMVTVGPGGRVALIAPDIENSGIIQAPGGQILLAAGRKLEIASLDLEGVTFEIQAPTDSVLNLGKLLAENGAVHAFAGNLRHSGEIRAGRLALDSDGSIMLAGSNSLTLTADSITRADGIRGGNVVLQSAQGTARVAGAVSATGASGVGGSVQVLGERVAIESSARIDASGSAGGGSILVGGDFQGANASVQNAARVFVGEGAQLVADATVQGHGGRVIVWADENTRYFGNLSARGGPLGGDGGFAEVSGRLNLEFAGTAHLEASAGTHGTLLLDPLDLIVSASSGILPTVVDEFTDFPGNVVTVSPTALNNVGGNVVLQASRHVYIKSSIALATAGASLSITAGGPTFDSVEGGTIYFKAPGNTSDPVGITTNGGAVTLRAVEITDAGSASGTISTAGGAVDLLTSGTLSYTGSIASAGGSVTLASQNGSVNSANVNAGAGTINVTGRSGVFSGEYVTTGTANLTATAGGISSNDIQANVVNLSATSSISTTVEAGDRVNATSSGSYVQLFDNGASPLRLGTVNGNSGVYLSSSNGMTQASGGVLTAPFFQLSTNGSATSAGTLAAPLLLAAPSAQVEPVIYAYDLQAPVHLAFSGSPTLGGLTLQGSVAGIGASTVAFGGTANLTGFSLGTTNGVLTVSGSATGGMSQGLSLLVFDGGINASNLVLPGAPVSLDASTTVDIGTLAGASLSVQARGAVSINSASTTGSSGVYVYTQSCDYSTVACAAVSPITLGTVTAGGSGSINLSTYDNGAITATNLTAGGGISINAGDNYRTSQFFQNYTDQPTTNSIQLGTVSAGGSVSINNNGQGNVGITSLSGASSVNINAGTTFTPTAFTSQRTTNAISIGNVEPVGAINDFNVTNNGIGSVQVTGAVDRSNSGDIRITSFDGSVTALGALTARDTITVQAGTTGALAVGTLVAGSGSSNGVVTLTSGADLSFTSIAVTAVSASSGNVALTSSAGSIKTTQDNTAADISASGNVTLSATNASQGVLGDSSFTNPLDIHAGTGKVVTLSAGLGIGADLKPVTVDTDGSLIASSTGGQFHLAATDGTAEKSLSTIRLSASAAGIGNGNRATFTSLDLDVTGTSDGSTITVGNLVRGAGTLNEFSYSATGGSGLAFGDVNFSSAGLNGVFLNADNGLTQATPLTNNIVAGTVNLAGGTGLVQTGAITARSVRATGASFDTGAITTTGTSRSTFNAIADTLTISATGDVLIGGNLSSATVIDVSSTGGNITVGGAVASSGGSRNTFRAAADQVRLQASTGDISTTGAVTSLTSTAVVAGGSVTVGGSGIDGGTSLLGGNNLADFVNVVAGAAGTISTQAITDGYTKTVSGGTLNIPGGITGAAQGTTVSGTTFQTGNIATGGTLSITATGAYVPGAPIALSGTSSVSISAPDGIDLVTSGTSLTSPTVTLTTQAGNITAALTSTSNLTVNTGGSFDLSSNVALGNLNITADGMLAGAGAGSRVAANSNNQLLTYVTSGNSLALGLASTTNLSDRYAETSSAISDIVMTTTGTFGASGGGVNVSAPVANIALPSVTLGGGSVTLSTGGNLALTALNTGGGSVSAFTSGGSIDLTSVATGGGSFSASTNGASQDVRVQSVVTLGGSVSLSSASGSIERSGAQPLQINSANGQGLPSGTTTLSAANGSVGALGTLLTSGAQTLNVTAKDTIAVDVATTPLSNLSITTGASGTGTVTVTNSNFGGLSVARTGGGTALTLGALAPTTAAGFSLIATDGDLVVAGDVTNITSLGLNAGRGFNGTGDLLIQASGGPRTVSANNYNLQAGRDVRISSGAVVGENVSVSQVGPSGATSVSAGRDVILLAQGGSALLAHTASGNTQNISAGGEFRVQGGSTGTGASAAVTATGFQSLSVSGDLVVAGGASDGGSAQLNATQSQSFSNVLGSVRILGGGGVNAFAEIASNSGQTLGSTSTSVVTDLVLVQGGTGAGAYASARAGASQTVQSSGELRVLGGTGAGAYAELKAATNQTVGSTSTFFNDPTGSIQVLAGSGGTAALLAGGQQNVQAGDTISVVGGSGTGMSARIETTSGGQTIGSSGTSNNDPTSDILVQAGIGDGAFAAIKAPGFQTISTGGNISVLGNSGAGAYAEIVSTGSGQNIGNTSTNFNDATGSLQVRAGSGGLARIQALSSQNVRVGGDLSVIGGDGVGLTASIESTASSQNIGQTGFSSNDPSDAVLVQGGTATGAAAWIRAATGQTLRVGRAITLTGTVAGAFAEVSTTSGTQTISNASFSSSVPDSITLSGGTAAGAYARMTTGGSQSLSTAANLTLTGGAGDGSGALLASGSGQSLSVQGNLAMTGGSGSAPGLNETAIRNAGTGTQSLNVSGDMAITGGGFGSDTWVKQNGSGAQNINVSGNLALLAPAGTPSTGVTSIESLAGGQTLEIGGAVSVNNQAGWITAITSGAGQTVDAASLSVVLASTNGSAPFAGLSATGLQTLTLNGDGATAGSATVSIANTSNAANALAAIRTQGDMILQMNTHQYDAAGLVQVGTADGQGAATISAGGDLTLVAGALRLQGGATAASDARLLSGAQPPSALSGTMNISTVYGPVEMLGGVGGGAYIDPLQLNIVSNSAVLMQAGANSSANTNINAGTLNLAATAGNLSLINSTTSSATSTITAGTFNMQGAGNVVLQGGTITVANPSVIDITGICVNCDTNLLPRDQFTVTAFIPPPTDFGVQVAGEILALSDLSLGLYETVLDADGNLLLSRRRLNQCY